MECSVGLFVNEFCHKTCYHPFSKEIFQVSDLPPNEQTLIRLRLSESISSICQYHRNKYVGKYNHIFDIKR